MNDLNKLSEQEIALRLGKQIPATHDIPHAILSGECRHAGVLVPFVRVQDSWHLLFIRRSEFEHDVHSGQVAFAGGKLEESDINLEATALREAQEEIGIQPQDVRILGQLSHHYTISHFRVVPVVATLPWPYDLQLDEEEVAHAFTIPLDWLADASNHQLRFRQLSSFKDPVPVVYFNEYEGELLWGATARMTLSLIDALTT